MIYYVCPFHVCVCVYCYVEYYIVIHYIYYYLFFITSIVNTLSHHLIIHSSFHVSILPQLINLSSTTFPLLYYLLFYYYSSLIKIHKYTIKTTTQDHTNCPSTVGVIRRYFSLILSFARMIFVRLPSTRFPSRDKYSPLQRSATLVSCL